MSKTAVIVPCYNEARRLKADVFAQFLSDHSSIDLFFVDDGSTDGTGGILGDLVTLFAAQVFVIQFPLNKGKAFAVWTGFQRAIETKRYTHIGYLDADLSTSLSEFSNLYDLLAESGADYIFGSRIKMLDTNIQRSYYRHLCGRSIATIIDLKVKLGIYDTQCGAKLFRTDLLTAIIEEPFQTRWLFDVEIFMRIRRVLPLPAGIESPLKEWKDAKGSKISTLNFMSICKDVATLYRLHKKTGI